MRKADQHHRRPSMDQGTGWRRPLQWAGAGLMLGCALVTTELADVQAASDAQPPPASIGPVEAPPEVKTALAALNHELDRVDAMVVAGNVAQARTELEALQKQLDTIREEHGAELPRGYVPMFVAEERIDALRTQLGRQ